MQSGQGYRKSSTRTVAVSNSYKPEMFVFIDETGTDRCEALRTHGYSLCGVPAKYQKALVRGSSVSTIAAMSTDGIILISRSVKKPTMVKPFTILWRQSCFWIYNHLMAAAVIV